MRRELVSCAVMLVVLSLPAIAQQATAFGPEALCAELESTRPGQFVYGESGPYLTASTLRPTHEIPAVGRSVVKGAMARKLSAELDGARVRWSGALLKGPVACGALNAFQILVNPIYVRVTED